MRELPVYQVDAFTAHAFGGNPAAVCPVDAFLDDDVMQMIARENNLSETAFIVARADRTKADYDLRWFTPTVEVDLCGHATLGASYVVFNYLEPDLATVRFDTRSGVLTITKTDDGEMVMDFPATPPAVPDHDFTGLAEAMGGEVLEILQRDRDYLIAYASQDEIEALNPDGTALKNHAPYGFIATAPGRDVEVDFVSRCFYPNHGIYEDPVTGSAHCLSGPYWAEKLGKAELKALQLSERGGELKLHIKGERMDMQGQAVPTMRGMLMIG